MKRLVIICSFHINVSSHLFIDCIMLLKYVADTYVY